MEFWTLEPGNIRIGNWEGPYMYMTWFSFEVSFIRRTVYGRLDNGLKAAAIISLHIHTGPRKSLSNDRKQTHWIV